MCEAFNSTLATARMLFAKRGKQTLFCDIWTYGMKAIEFQSFKNSNIELNYLLFLKKHNFCIAYSNVTNQSLCTPFYIEDIEFQGSTN